MKIREAITKIIQHPIYNELAKVKGCTESEFYKRYNFQIFEYRHWYKDDKYSTRLDYYLINKLTKQLPEINCKIEFNYGVWGLVQAYIKVRVNEYDRRGTSIEKCLHFHFVNQCGNRIVWEHKFELSDNFNLNNPIPALKAMLRPIMFEEGLIALIQHNRNTTKKDAKWWYINHYKPGKLNYGCIDDSTIYKWVKKHFNIDSCLSIEDTINFVNVNGKKDKLTKIEKYDMSWFWNFDGDEGELENEFYATIDNDTIYV